MNNRLVTFICKHRILTNRQFGFQKSKSTTQAVLSVVEQIYSSLNDKKHVLGIGVDLSKAFDTVSHQILIQKLYRYGIRGVPLSWLRSYLQNRVQSVRAASVTSTECVITHGVPQGSVLGPLLLLCGGVCTSPKLVLVHFFSIWMEKWRYF